MSLHRALKIVQLSAVLLLLTVCVALAATNHKEYRDAAPDECRDCHRDSGVLPNHGPFFMTEHRVLAQKATSNCADCHEQSFCLDCHKGGNIETDVRKSLSRRGETMPRTHRSDFLSIHALKAADDPKNCYRCHETSFCTDCHGRQIQRNRAGMSIKRFDSRATHAPTFVANGVPDPAWVSFHSADARRNLQSCQGCHPQKSDCTNFACHPNLGGK
jgi:hypothetical protein